MCHSRPCSSCVPPTPTTSCRNSLGASSTSSSRRSRPSRSPHRAASAADGLVFGDGTKGNTTPQRLQCLDSCHTSLASAEQHRPRREADGIGHQNGELLRHEPAHVAYGQPEAVPEEPEEHRVDLHKVVSEPKLRWSDACFNL